MTKRLYFFSLIVLTFCACKKRSLYEEMPTPPETSVFNLNDSLKINSLIASQEPAIYDRYNGKYYTVHSVNKVGFNVRKIGAGILFDFADSSVPKLTPSFTITILNAEYTNLLPQYDMTNSTQITLADEQDFMDGSRMLNFSEVVKSGVLKINYNQDLNTVSGEIDNLKFPIGYYVPEDIGSGLRSTNSVYLEGSGSFRSVNLQFNFVPVK